jgi:hypothetical protein
MPRRFIKNESNGMTIVILASDGDEHAAHIHERLCDIGADAVLLDPSSFPSATKISFDPRTGDGEICISGRPAIAFDSVRSVFWRGYDGVGQSDLPHPEQRYIAENDSRGLFESMLMRLPALWVNSWAAVQLHQTKPAQLAIVSELGVAIPNTMVTNSAVHLTRFARAHARSIFKPVQGGAHARDIGREELGPEALGRLRLAPVTIQEHVPGTNIRAFVIGDEVLACEIMTSAIDFRDDPYPEIVPHALPSTQAAQCIAIARALGLVWTGIDFRLTPGGTYVFLEANPSPMFLGFEQYAGLPITEKVVALLTGEAPSFCDDEAALVMS